MHPVPGRPRARGGGRSLQWVLDGTTATAGQVEFFEFIIEHLTHDGVTNPAQLYKSLFTDIAPAGPDQVFSSVATDRLIERIRSFDLFFAEAEVA